MLRIIVGQSEGVRPIFDWVKLPDWPTFQNIPSVDSPMGDYLGAGYNNGYAFRWLTWNG